MHEKSSLRGDLGSRKPHFVAIPQMVIFLISSVIAYFFGNLPKIKKFKKTKIKSPLLGDWWSARVFFSNNRVPLSFRVPLSSTYDLRNFFFIFRVLFGEICDLNSVGLFFPRISKISPVYFAGFNMAKSVNYPPRSRSDLDGSWVF